VVANVPFAGMPNADYTRSDDRFVALRDAVLGEDSGDPASFPDPIGPVAVVTEPDGTLPMVFLPQEESAEWFLDRGRRDGVLWENRVLLRRAFGGEPAFDPGVAIAHLHAPTQFVVGSNDRVAAAEVALAAYERAPEPKDLVAIDGHHFTPYSGDAFTVAAESARDWFLRWL
jgi:pimeloyl-ACP methyl ester carboxylesterase